MNNNDNNDRWPPPFPPACQQQQCQLPPAYQQCTPVYPPTCIDFRDDPADGEWRGSDSNQFEFRCSIWRQYKSLTFNNLPEILPFKVQVADCDFLIRIELKPPGDNTPFVRISVPEVSTWVFPIQSSPHHGRSPPTHFNPELPSLVRLPLIIDTTNLNTPHVPSRHIIATESPHVDILYHAPQHSGWLDLCHEEQIDHRQGFFLKLEQDCRDSRRPNRL